MDFLKQNIQTENILIPLKWKKKKKSGFDFPMLPSVASKKKC